MEESNDKLIQEYLEANRSLPPSKEVRLYQQLFAELGKEPSIQPSASFALNVVNQVKQQPATSAIKRVDWLITGSMLFVFLASFLGLLYWYQPTMLSVAWHSFGLAKEWLWAGLSCIGLFLALEHRLLQKELINRSCLE